MIDNSKSVVYTCHNNSPRNSKDNELLIVKYMSCVFTLFKIRMFISYDFSSLKKMCVSMRNIYMIILENWIVLWGRKDCKKNLTNLTMFGLK